MSTDSKSDALWHLADALSEDILNTPAEDLFAEVEADHGNSRAVATEFDRICRQALRRVRRQEYIERLKQLINLPVPAPSFAIISIGVLAVIVIATALWDWPFGSAEKQPTNLASPAAGGADPIALGGAPKVAAQGSATIVVAARQLPFGTQLTPDSVEEIPWAATVFPAGAFRSKEALFKEGRRISVAAIQPNEPVLSSKITGPSERASLSTLLEQDTRAITIRVDDVRGVAGFILPNDRVDVVLIRNATDASASRQSDLLLQDVKVIAIDQIASQQKDSPTVAKAVTLEVTPYEAQKISLATNVGSLSLILRRAADAAVVANSRVTEIALSDEPRLVPPAPAPAPVRIEAPPPPPPPSDSTVTIIRNLKGMDYKVMKEGHGGRGS
jgi:pilus assembly protein CpaB